MRDFIGGRATSDEKDLASEARDLQTQGLVGVRVDVEHLGSANRSMRLLAASGTAVMFVEQD